MKQNIFPAFSEKEVLERVKRAWDLSTDFPIPKFRIICPICKSEAIQARNWQFQYRDVGGCKYRCNVSFKCTQCSHAWVHGVVIPEELFRKHVRGNVHQTKLYHWREVKKMLEILEYKETGHANLNEIVEGG